MSATEEEALRIMQVWSYGVTRNRSAQKDSRDEGTCAGCIYHKPRLERGLTLADLPPSARATLKPSRLNKPLPGGLKAGTGSQGQGQHSGPTGTGKLGKHRQRLQASSRCSDEGRGGNARSPTPQMPPMTAPDRPAPTPLPRQMAPLSKRGFTSEPGKRKKAPLA